MTINIKLFLAGLLASFFVTYVAYQPMRTYDKDEGEAYARKRINEVLTDTTYKNFYDQPARTQILIPTANIAMKVAEPILIEKYGAETVYGERPYQAFRIDNFWLVKGSWPDNPGLKGGTFEIIIDARDARVIRIVHYK
jgi:hypothetical protein